jgi:hypothetical protein
MEMRRRLVPQRREDPRETEDWEQQKQDRPQQPADEDKKETEKWEEEQKQDQD